MRSPLTPLRSVPCCAGWSGATAPGLSASDVLRAGGGVATTVVRSGSARARRDVGLPQVDNPCTTEPIELLIAQLDLSGKELADAG